MTPPDTQPPPYEHPYDPPYDMMDTTPLYTLFDFTPLSESVPDSEGPPFPESVSPPTSPLLSESDYFANSESEVLHPLLSLVG